MCFITYLEDMEKLQEAKVDLSSSLFSSSFPN